MRVSVLVISGSMGSGKTTVLGEISDLLATAGIAHAAINLHALGIVHASGVTSDDMAYRNLAAVWHNYAAAGMRFWIARTSKTSASTTMRTAASPTSRGRCWRGWDG